MQIAGFPCSVEKVVASPYESIHLYIHEIGYESCTVTAWIFLLSTQKQSMLSISSAKTIGIARSNWAGSMTSSSWIFAFSFLSSLCTLGSTWYGVEWLVFCLYVIIRSYVGRPQFAQVVISHGIEFQQQISQFSAKFCVIIWFSHLILHLNFCLVLAFFMCSCLHRVCI